MSRTWTAATPVRVTEPGGRVEYIRIATAQRELQSHEFDALRWGYIVEGQLGTYQLIPEAVAMADLPLENGR